MGNVVAYYESALTLLPASGLPLLLLRHETLNTDTPSNGTIISIAFPWIALG
jgi:hypothetical protein